VREQREERGGEDLIWVVRVGGDDGELRPWHHIYVYSIESRLIRRKPTPEVVDDHRSVEQLGCFLNPHLHNHLPIT
jgi:hypothetical protein